MDKLKDLDVYIERYGAQLIDFIPTLLSALLILVLGWWFIKFVNRVIRKYFDGKDFDPTLYSFIKLLIDRSLKILLFVLVITQLGVETASLIAMIGAATLAVGLALQGSLANFAGGILILILRPFKVGDWIEAQSVSGTVSEISIFNTRITTFGNQIAIIPNGKLSNEKIVNYSILGVRREALSFGISYDSDIRKAKKILLDLVNSQEKVLKDTDKTPMVAVAGLQDSYVELTLRYWAKSEDFWALRWYVLEEGKVRLDKAGIEIPFPQHTVHLKNNNK